MKKLFLFIFLSPILFIISLYTYTFLLIINSKELENLKFSLKKEFQCISNTTVKTELDKCIGITYTHEYLFSIISSEERLKKFLLKSFASYSYEQNKKNINLPFFIYDAVSQIGGESVIYTKKEKNLTNIQRKYIAYAYLIKNNIQGENNLNIHSLSEVDEYEHTELSGYIFAIWQTRHILGHSQMRAKIDSNISKKETNKIINSLMVHRNNQSVDLGKIEKTLLKLFYEKKLTKIETQKLLQKVFECISIENECKEKKIISNNI